MSSSSLEEGQGRPGSKQVPNEWSALLATKSSSIITGQVNVHDDTVEAAVDKMKQVTHNDPQLATQDEDFKNLLGSTRLLYNATVEQELVAEIRRKSTSFAANNGGKMSSMPGGGTYSNHIVLDGSGHDDGNNNGRQQQQHETFTSHVQRLSLVSSRASEGLSLIYNKQRDNAILYLEKVKHSFFEDAKSLAAGTIPQSIVVASVIGIVCGIACWIYYTILNFFLEYLWKTLPEKIVVGVWREDLYWLWIPLVSFVMISLVGLTVVYMGEPGDLPYTIDRVHAQAFIPMDHVHPMAFASLFSILGESRSGYSG
jgi:hypothetical protein